MMPEKFQISVTYSGKPNAAFDDVASDISGWYAQGYTPEFNLRDIAYDYENIEQLEKLMALSGKVESFELLVYPL